LYKDISSEVKRLKLEKNYDQLRKERLDASNLSKAKRLVDEASGVANQARKLTRDIIADTPRTRERFDLSNMTDQQLREAINRGRR